MDGRPLERRQLTIMFTDLVDSTGLADSMDPEDFRTLIEAHRTIAVAPILRYGGVVARYLGDGMLVLFGYPEAHEDDPERAVRAGLEIASATESMNSRWVGEGKGRIAVRIGVHTGIVVIGDVLKADVQEIMAVFGNAPSIASRLQALARPNSVVLSGATKALLPPSIHCETRGNTTLRGIKRPVEIFSAIEVREGAHDRRVTGAVLPFVNREGELATIRQCWAAARRGEGRCLTVEGDPGIGKSRLIRAVEERIVTQPSRWLITRTSPYAANTDFFAFSELFHQLLVAGEPADASFSDLRHTLKEQGLDRPDIAIGFAGLLGIDIPKDATSTPLQPERVRELIMAACTTWFHHHADKVPMVLVVEDLHWADASSLEVIERLKTDLADHPLLLILTTRGAAGTALTGAMDEQLGPGGVTSADAGEGDATQTAPAIARSIVSETWPPKPTQASKASAAGTIRMERLGAAYARDLLDHVLQGANLPKTAVTTLLERANGVPLYLEELPKPALEAQGGADDTSIILPATLRDSLMAQLDRMGEAKTVAQTAAVLGHSFELPLLEHVWEGNAESLDTGLATLTDATLLTREGDAKATAYGFRHALLAEIAYDSLLRDDRRRIHRRTAEILGRHFRTLSETRPELVARHHDTAGNHEEAFECWLKAANAAARRSANAEALGHLRNAEAMLEQFGTADDVAVRKGWLALYLARGPILISRLGWAVVEVEETYRKALSLCESMNMAPWDKFPITGGLFSVYLLRGDLKDARSLMEQSHQIAKGEADPDLLTVSHRGLGLCDFFAGRFAGAVQHMSILKQLLVEHPILSSRQTSIYGTNPLVIALSIKAWSRWFQGDDVEAVKTCEMAVAAARDARHPFSECYALCLAGSVAQSCNQVADALAYAESALEVAAEHSFAYWRGWAKIIRGWALAASGKSELGIADLHYGLAQYESTDAAQMSSYNQCLLAESYFLAHRWKEGVDRAVSAIANTEKTGIAFYQSEAYRLLGVGLCHRDGASRHAFGMLIRALRLSDRQQSLPLFTRAARSLLDWTEDNGLRIAVRERLSAMLRRAEPLCSPVTVVAAKSVLDMCLIKQEDE
ncbi:MAG: ATP-binding protein [Geminicoccaceae bacterium]